MPSDSALDHRYRWLPALAGCLAFSVSCATFWCFEHPWTLRGDNKAVIFPMNLAAFRSWMSGYPPEWSDGIWAGFPLLADPTSLSLYWPNFIWYLLTPEPHLRAFDLATAFHCAILVAGLVHLLRMLGVGTAAALLGGLLIAIAPMYPWQASAIFTVYAPVAWWPWMLVAAERLSRDGMRLSSLLLGWLSLATCAFVFPEFALYGGVVASLWLISGGLRPLRQRLVAAAVFCLGGVVLAAPQLLATATLLPDTMRGAEGVRHMDQPTRMFTAAMVLYPGTEDWLPSFLGIVTLIIAVMGVWRGGPRVWFFAGLAIVASLLCVGNDTPLYPLMRSLPGFGMFRGAMKFKLLTELAVMALAAFGTDWLLRQQWQGPARRLAMLLIVLMLCEHGTYTAMRVPSVKLLPGSLDTSFADLYHRLTASGLAEHVRGDAEQPRPRISERVALRALPILAGIPSMSGGPNSLLPRRHDEIARRYSSYRGPTREMMRYFGVTFDLRRALPKSAVDKNPCLRNARLRRLLLLGQNDETCLYADPSPPGRFAVPFTARASPSQDAMLRTVYEEVSGVTKVTTVAESVNECGVSPPDRTPASLGVVTLAVDESVPIVAPIEEVAKRMRSTGQVELIDFRQGDFRLAVAANRPAFLLVKESYFEGWEATVDGKPAAVYPAAGLFFAVPFPAGQHEIRVTYRAPGFRLGVWLASTWIAVAFAVELLRRFLALRGRRHAVAGSA